MIRKAVIDRFEEEYAVLLLDQGEEKLVILRSQLPQGAREGHWLQITFAGQSAEPQQESSPADAVESGEYPSFGPDQDESLGTADEPEQEDLPDTSAGTARSVSAEDLGASRSLPEAAAPEILSIVIDEEETAQVKSRISDKLNRLRRGDHRSG
jgi:hypothetical protein